VMNAPKMKMSAPTTIVTLNFIPYGYEIWI
jgi:hypothetical protein